MSEFAKQFASHLVIGSSCVNDVVKFPQEYSRVFVPYSCIPLAASLGPMYSLVSGRVSLGESSVPDTLRVISKSEIAPHVVETVVVDMVDEPLATKHKSMQVNQFSAAISLLDPSCSIKRITDSAMDYEPIEPRELFVPAGVNHSPFVESQPNKAVRFPFSVKDALRNQSTLCILFTLMAEFGSRVFGSNAARALITQMSVFISKFSRMIKRSDSSFARRHCVSPSQRCVRLDRTLFIVPEMAAA
jgi:hypothetical protein